MSIIAKKRRSDDNTEQGCRTGFLAITAGGTGEGAGETLELNRNVYGLPIHIVHIDTDRSALSSKADTRICIGLNANDAKAIQRNSHAYVSASQVMLKKYPLFLDESSIHNGARTCRMVTQVSFERHRAEIMAKLHLAIRKLIQEHNVSHIVVVLASSTGGGTGSATVVLLTHLFNDKQFKSMITEGVHGTRIEPPVLVLAEPYTYAIHNNPMQANRIMANMMATRIETAIAEREHAFQYAFHLGMANAGGAMMDRQSEIRKQLGAAIVMLCKNWSWLKARWVDTVDCHQATARYSGRDVPENVFPQEMHPPFASTASNTKSRRSGISMCNNYEQHHGN